ncbi:MAG: NADH-quinone oxidoreductase subunit L, partial [Stellaceae bacterium]
FLTAFYSWRVIFLTFHGKPRASKEVMAHVHESPPVMILPLVVLAAGATFAGMIGYHWLVGAGREAFWGDSILVLPGHDTIAGAETAPFWVSKLPLAMGLAGILVAWIAYIVQTGIPAWFVHYFRPIYLFILNKWYVDELYDAVIVRPAMWFGVRLWKDGDGVVIDGLGPDGLAKATRGMATVLSRFQTGYLYHYVFAMFVGAVVLVSWYVLRQMG